MINCLKIGMAFIFLIHAAGGEPASNFETTSLHTQDQENCLFQNGLYLLAVYFHKLAKCGSGHRIVPLVMYPFEI